MLADALWDDPFYQAISVDFADRPGRRRMVLAEYFALSMDEGGRIGLCLHTGEAALGAAIWLLPGEPSRLRAESLRKQARLHEHLGPRGEANYHRIVGFMSPHADKAVPAGAWYLSILGVDPGRQGGGVGAALLAPTLAQASRLGADCYLETFTPRNLPFYQRLGFRPIGRHLEPVTGAEYAILYREPGARQAG